MKHSLDKRRRPKRRPVAFESLEPRLLLSADLAPALAPFAHDALPPIPAEHRSLEAMAELPQVVMAQEAARASELVFVDSTLPDYQRLVDDVLRATGGERPVEVILLDPSRDGVAQMTEALAGRTGLAAVHLVTHGGDGRLQLGDATLDAAALATHSDAIAGWSRAFAADGDLLLYGCNVAETARGGAFIDALALLTGTDVAASEDRTGAARLGGDWDLERTTGVIEGTMVPLADAAWGGLLATEMLDWDAVAASGTNPYPASALAWTSDAIAGGSISFSFSGDTGNITTGPVVDQFNEGGTALENALHVSLDLLDNVQQVVWTIDFSHLAGVSNVSFTIFDIDVGGFVDSVSVTSDRGNPVITGSVNNSVAGNTVTGVTNTPQTGVGSDEANATFVFSQSGITQITITYKHDDATDPSGQGISLHDISFDPTPTASDRTVAVDEDNTYAFAAGDFGFSDVGGDTLQRIRITQLETAGSLRLNGVDVALNDEITRAQIDGGQLTFVPAANASGSPYANFRFQVSDGASFSVATYQMRVNVNAVNDAPLATNLSAPETYTEDTALDLTDIVVSDIDSANVTAILTLSDLAAGALNTATSGSVTSTFAGGVWTASGAIADVNALLAGLTFTPAANYNANFTITTSVSDGVAPALIGTKAMTGTPVNDAPALAGANAVSGITEDPGANPGTAVATLLAGQVTDVDAGALPGIAVTAADNANGAWEYSTDGGGIWNPFGAPAAGSARLLRDADLVRFVPNADWNGTATLSFRAWDRTSGVFGGTADTATNGGTTAFSTAIRTASIAVSAVGDTVNDTTVTDEDNAVTVNVLGNDNFENAGCTLTAVAGATNGTVSFTAAGAITYTPNANWNGSETLTYTITSNGVNETGTLGITVNAVNDAPTLAAVPQNPTFTEDGAAPVLFTGAAASAIEAGQGFDSLVLTVSNLADGVAEQLSIDGEFVSLTHGTSLTTAASSYTVSVSVSGATATVTIGTGSVNAATLQTLVNGLAYRNASQDPTTGTRTVTLTSLSDTGSSLAPNIDTTALAIGSIVTVVATADAPVATAGATTAYTENTAAVVIDNTLTVSDADDTQIAGATISISTGLSVGDVLGFVNIGPISGVYTPATGLLTLSGTDTLANYRTALRSVSYLSTSEDPTALSSARTISWQVTDANSDGLGAQISAPVTSTLNLTAINDAPTLSATAQNPTFTEDLPAATLFSGSAASTVEAGQNFDSLVLTVASLADGAAEQLRIDGEFVSLVNGANALTAANGFSVNVSAAAGTATVTITRAANATAAQVETLVNALAYQNTSQDPTVGARTVTLASLSDTGSSLAPNIDTTALAIGSIVTVVATADAPVATAGATTAYTENTAAVVIDNTLTVSDADDTQIAGATISISTGLSVGDVLGFVNIGPISGVYTPATGLLTLSGTDTLANYRTALRSVSYLSTSEDPTALSSARTISWQVTDANSDGLGAQISAPVTSTLNLTATADAPVATAGATTAYTENTAAVVIDNTLTVSDADDTQIAGATISISTGLSVGDVLGFVNIGPISGVYTPATGLLTLSGTDTLANYRTALRSVSYLSTSEDPTALSSARTISWQVTDANSDGLGAQISAPVTSTLNLTATADAPVATAGATTAYTENTAAVVIDNTLTVSDADDTQIAGATISISTGLSVGDVLGFVNIGPISGVYTPATGLLTLSGTDTLANYRTALRSVSYLSTSEDPTALSSARTISWQVTDANSDGLGAQISAPVTSTLNLTATADAPVATAGATTAYTENTAAVVIDNTLTVSDADDTQIAGATISISTGLSVGDVLGFVNIGPISGVYTPATGLLTLSGTDTLANYRTALRSVSYLSTSEDPTALSSARTISWQVTDANSDGLGAQISAPVTSTLNLTATADAPVATAGATTAYTENTAAVVIDNTLTVSDADDTQIAGATISISTGLSVGDVLGFVNIGPISGVYTPATGLLTLSGTDTLANYRTALRSVSYLSTSEDPTALSSARTISWQVTDANSDGLGAQISAPVTSTLNLTATADAPVATAGATTAYTENTAAVVIDNTLTVSDADDTQIAGATISISTGLSVGDVLGFVNIGPISGVYTPATGLLTLSGTDTLANYRTALRSVSYLSTSEDPTALSSARTISWQVTDANSDGLGAQISAPVTSTLNLTATADAPVATAGATTAYTENTAAVVIDNTLTVSDADDTQIAGATISISTGLTVGDVLGFVNIGPISGVYTPATGLLTLSGTDTLANYRTALRSVSYLSTSEDPTALSSARTISWQVTDANSDGLGAQISAPVTSTLNLTATADAPVATAGATTAYTENTAAVVIDNTLTVSDADDTQIAGATISISTGLTVGDVLGFVNIGPISGVYTPATGLLTLSGTDTLANYRTALRSVSYLSTSEDPTALSSARTISWQVTDANSDGLGAQISAPVTSTLNLTATADAPVATAGATTAYTENTAAVVIDNTLTVSDADDTQIAGATISISTGLSVGDVLGFVNIGPISGVYTPATGLLTLSGTDTLANYRTALRSVSYLSTSEDPTALSSARTISWQVTDANSDGLGAQISAPVTSTLNLTATADAPVATAGATTAYTENTAAVVIDNTLTVSDADDTQIAGATISISTGLTVGDVLGFVNIGPISGVYTPATGLLTLSGTDTLANYRTALRSVSYLSTSEDPTALSSARTISWQVTDANSDGLGAQISAPVTSTLNLTAINDAPTLSATAQNPTFTEDGAGADLFSGLAISTIEVGQMIDQIVLTVTNVTDGASEILSIDGLDVALTNGNSVLTAGNGLSVSVSLVGSSATVTVSRAGGVSSAAMQTVVDTLAYRNTSQNPSTANRVVTLTSIRDSGGTANGGVDATALGIASTASVVAVNDAPVLGPVALSIDPLQTVTMTGGNMSATDVDDPSASLVFLVAGATNGQFELAAAPGVRVTSFTQAQLASGAVRFVHTNAGFGPSFSIFVTDGAATAGPGVAIVSFRAPGAEPPAPAKQPEPARAPVVAGSEVLLTGGGGFGQPAATDFIRAPFAPSDTPAVIFAEAPAEATIVLARPVRAAALLDLRAGGAPGDGFVEAERIPTGLPKMDFAISAVRHDDSPPPLDIAFGSARITGMALSVGAVWWAARAGGLLASLLASTPAWRHVDPLPVLGRDDDEPEIDWNTPDKNPPDEEASEAAVFDEGRAAKEPS